MSHQYDYHHPPPPPPPQHHHSPHSPGSAGFPPAGLSPRALHAPPPPTRRPRPVSVIYPSNIVTSNLPAGSNNQQVPYSAIAYSGSPSILAPSAAPQQQQQQQTYTPSATPPWPSASAGSPSLGVHTNTSQTQLAVPGTPMEPYNPRQWGHRGQVSGSQMVFAQQQQQPRPLSTVNLSGLEAAMPSPPPPYTPSTPDAPHRNTTQPAMDNIGAVVSPVIPTTESFAVSSPAVRHSPQVPMSPAFPPPPGPASRHRERSSSGLAGRSGFFGLSGLRGKQPVQQESYSPQPPTMQLPVVVPPAARRAASAGQVQSYSTPTASSSSSAVAPQPAGRDSPEASWRPGMPLPGPPPGPPPPGVRSQSLNRPIASSSSSSADPGRSLEAPRPRRVLATSNLGPIPPTPADWVTGAPNPDNLHMAPSADRQHTPVDGATMEPLRIDTSGASGGARDSSLTRRPAKRGESASGLRARRSQSRQAKGAEESAGPSNLVLSPVDGSISRRREHNRTISHYTEPRSAPSGTTASAANSSGSGSTAKGTSVGESVITPPYTPAVGRPAEDPLRRQVLKVPGSASSEHRPSGSQLLHAANEETVAAQASPGRPPSSGSLKPGTGRLDSFALQAIERHRAFVDKELAAASDEERLELFAAYIVHESRLRRDRYPAAYSAMAAELVDLTRDMWRSYTKGGAASRRAPTPINPNEPGWGSASDGQPNSARGSSFGDYTPGTDASSAGDPNEPRSGGGRGGWPDAFKPSLSPIASMAVSTAPGDDQDSRGRAPSRWWEQSVTGSGSIGRPDRMEKTRRETKYMGVTAADLRDSSPDPNGGGPLRSGGQPYGYGPNEYPPEKVGWHEEYDYTTPMATPHRSDGQHVATPGVHSLDVSRLVTLPPPYPRHHPAVSNSHPLLADLRGEHRLLIQRDDIQKIKDASPTDTKSAAEQTEAAKQRRMKMRTAIQTKIADGSMSYAGAAKAEADFDAEEAERGKAAARANFDAFEARVSHPLNALLSLRLAKADNCIAQLTADLEQGHESSNPDQAQEEGDERPERLEKLTLLKWLFEARELLHKDMFDLHAARSDQYAEVILVPYRLARQQAKIDEATAFFTKDARQRQLVFAKESLARFEHLQAVVDANVTRGVEDQLSAFWDIAPGLLAVVQHIPADLAEIDIAIPAQEYAENPAYHTFPLQYLYSLLAHANKSAYQFIESQINLLCLLHEVRTATSTSALRLLEMERFAAAAAAPNAEQDPEILAEMQQARLAAEDHLTQDLKEKVREVERQWKEALGDGMAECRARVGAWLEESGGLEDGLEV